MRLAQAPDALPAALHANGEVAGRITSVSGGEAFALLAVDAFASGATFTLADGGAVTIVSAPEPARPLGRP